MGGLGMREIRAHESALPCPFCGSSAKLFMQENVNQGGRMGSLYWYLCHHDGCGAGVTRGHWTETEALAQWNRRKG